MLQGRGLEPAAFRFQGGENSQMTIGLVTDRADTRIAGMSELMQEPRPLVAGRGRSL
jgi:hypothetical protein